MAAKTSSPKGGSSSSPAVASSPMVDVSATSLFHALSEIEQFSAAELREDIPDGVVPMMAKFSFIDVGVKSALVTTLATFIFTPIAMATIERIMPLFGGKSLSVFDQMFAYFFAAAPTITMALLIAVVSARVYRGNVTKTLINNLLTYYAVAKIAMSFIMMMVFYFAYYRVFTEGLIIKFVNFIHSLTLFKDDQLYSLYEFLMEFKEILTKSANLAGAIHIFTAGILLVSHIIGKIRTSKLEEFRKEWE